MMTKACVSKDKWIITPNHETMKQIDPALYT